MGFCRLLPPLPRAEGEFSPSAMFCELAGESIETQNLASLQYLKKFFGFAIMLRNKSYFCNQIGFYSF